MRLLILATLAVLLNGCSRSSSPSAKPATSPADDPACWMQSHLDESGDRTLKQLVLPASHDSAMYQGGFPQSLARTQALSIYGQLAVGIRYMDLRPQYADGQCRMHHGPVAGPKLAEVLNDVRRFMAEGHRELLLLKFSHYDGFTEENYKAMALQIKDQLGPWLYTALPPGKRLADIALGEYVRRSGAILVLCDGRYPMNNPVPGIWVYRDWDSRHAEEGDLCVYDQYSNTTSYEAMKADQFSKFNSYDGRCRYRPDLPCDLFLLSWTLTPPTDVLSFARPANAHLAADVGGWTIPNRFGCRVNLLYTDGVDSPALTRLAVELNHRSGGQINHSLH